MNDATSEKVLWIVGTVIFVILIVFCTSAQVQFDRKRDECIARYHVECDVVRHHGNEEFIPMNGYGSSH